MARLNVPEDVSIGSKVMTSAVTPAQRRAEQWAFETLEGVIKYDDVLDRKWREHLHEMDSLREGIGVHAIGRRDPLVEYQREGDALFEAMLEGVKKDCVGMLFNVQIEVAEDVEG